MSVLTVGRVGIDVEVADVEQWDMNGNQVSVAGVLAADTLAEAMVLRQQLLGHVGNGDEPIVPVTWTEDPSVDGFYRVTGAAVSTVPVSLSANWFEFSLGLERISGYATPIVETVVVGAVRTNDHSITSTNALAAVAVPDEVTELWDSSEPTSTDVFTRSTETGVVRVIATDTYTRRLHWSVPPQEWYEGAATITHGDAGLPVVGRQIPVHSDAYGYGTAYGSGGYGDYGENTWTLENGLLRVSMDANGFALESWDGAAWSTPKVIAPTAGGVAWGAVSPASGLRILRNSPAECVVRVPVVIPDAVLTATGFGTWRVDIDISLRRGDRLARFFIASTVDTVPDFGIEMVTAEAATAITGGIRATANDADGNRYVLASPHALTTDLVQGGITRTVDADVFAFAAGIEEGGSASAGLNTAQSLVYQYFGASSERTVVASR